MRAGFHVHFLRAAFAFRGGGSVGFTIGVGAFFREGGGGGGGGDCEEGEGQKEEAREEAREEASPHDDDDAGSGSGEAARREVQGFGTGLVATCGIVAGGGREAVIEDGGAELVLLRVSVQGRS